MISAINIYRLQQLYVLCGSVTNYLSCLKLLISPIGPLRFWCENLIICIFYTNVLVDNDLNE